MSCRPNQLKHPLKRHATRMPRCVSAIPISHSQSLSGVAGRTDGRCGVGLADYERTRSTLALGYVGLAEVLPVLLLALPAGHLSDRYDRRRIALITKTGLAACSLGFAALTIAHSPSGRSYVCIVGVGVMRAFHAPSTSTLLPQVVPIDLYESAAAWMSNFWQLAAALGPRARRRDYRCQPQRHAGLFSGRSVRPRVPCVYQPDSRETAGARTRRRHAGIADGRRSLPL